LYRDRNPDRAPAPPVAATPPPLKRQKGEIQVGFFAPYRNYRQYEQKNKARQKNKEQGKKNKGSVKQAELTAGTLHKHFQ
jgi:hypothetical protein